MRSRGFEGKSVLKVLNPVLQPNDQKSTVEIHVCRAANRDAHTASLSRKYVQERRAVVGGLGQEAMRMVGRKKLVLIGRKPRQ